MKKVAPDILTMICYSRIPAFVQLLIFSILPLVSHGAVFSVPGDYPTIQEAINAAAHGDEIIVSPGTYRENIYFHGKDIVLRSTDLGNPSVVASTVIDGHRAGCVVTFSDSEFTIDVRTENETVS